MGNIRWQTLPIYERMESVKPLLDQCWKETMEAQKGSNLPGYISQKLDLLADKVESAKRYAKYIQDYLPQDALARERREHELLQQIQTCSVFPSSRSGAGDPNPDGSGADGELPPRLPDVWSFGDGKDIHRKDTSYGPQLPLSGRDG